MKTFHSIDKFRKEKSWPITEKVADIKEGADFTEEGKSVFSADRKMK